MGLDLVSIAIEGGVVTQPALTQNRSGTPMLKFGVVCWPKWLNGQVKEKHSMYFTVSTCGKIAETVYPMLRVGMPVRVEGEYNDGIYRDRLTDESKIGRIIFASRIKIFVFWEFRSKSQKTKTLKETVENMTAPDINPDTKPL